VTNLIVDGSHGWQQERGLSGIIFLTLDVTDLTNALGKLPSYALMARAGSLR